MKKTTFGVLTVIAVAAGLAAAWFVAPALHRHSDPDAMTAMWADQYPSLERMARDVDAIVLATVGETRPGRFVPTASGAGLPFTLVDLQVERAIRGSASLTITLERTGGELGGRTIYLDGDGEPYVPGQKVLLFLKRQSDTDYYYLVNPQGRFTVRGGAVHAATPGDPVARRLDYRPVSEAIRIVEAIP